MLSTYSHGWQFIGNLYIFLCGVSKPLTHYPFILLGVFHLFMCRNKKSFFIFLYKKEFKKSFNFYDPVYQYVYVYVCVVSDLYVLRRRSLPTAS